MSAYHGLPIIPVPSGPGEVEGTVSTPAGTSDWCPPCGNRRRVDGKGRFRRHEPTLPEGGGRDGACWTTGMSKAQVELVEALESGAAWESLA